ncbi:MAG: hypothetical protein JNK85_22515 [Verrucomicrobiales bacterium]|nr:hypothetical protein [Verrucomicrobiales bacterium]
MSRDELLEPQGHTESFGRFAIGLDTEEARRLGMVPVFYYYRPEGPHGMAVKSRPIIDGGISQRVLFRLAELRTLLIALAQVEARSNPHSSVYMPCDALARTGLILEGEDRVAGELQALSTKAARKVFKLLDTDRVPAWNAAEWIELILSMFQTADSNQRSRHLAYFEQREWRIIQLRADGIICTPLDAQKASVLSADSAQRALYWGNAIEKLLLKYGGMRDSEAASFLRSSYLVEGTIDGDVRRPLRSYIREIIVPSIATKDAVDVIRSSATRFTQTTCGDFTVFSIQT